MASETAMEDAVQRSLDTLGDDPRWAAASQLALVYARCLDCGAMPQSVGPKLAAILDGLRLTPAAVKETSNADRSPDFVDELRSRRERRAKAVDAAAS